jgi:hypothetical protein
MFDARAVPAGAQLARRGVIRQPNRAGSSAATVSAISAATARGARGYS